MDKKDSVVSVVMPVYNGERFLRQAIESILGQTLKELEFIIIDDGSTDTSAAIISSYHEPRIRFIENGRNAGLTASLNKGIEHSRGEFIARMDADDISEPDRLFRELYFLRAHENVALVGSAKIIIDEEGTELTRYPALDLPDKIRTELTRSNQFCHGSVMFRKSCIQEVGAYRLSLKYAQDYDLWLRISEKHQVANINKYLYRLRFSMGSITCSCRFEQRQYEELIKSLANERSWKGSDDLDVYERLGIERILDSVLPNTEENRQRSHADILCTGAELFYLAGKYGRARRLIVQAHEYGAPAVKTRVLGAKIHLGMIVGRSGLSGLRKMTKAVLHGK